MPLEPRTREASCIQNLLSAIGYSPDLRKKLAQYERQLAGKEARTDPQHPDLFWRKVWFKLVPVLVATHDGEPEAVARDLIRSMPAELRAKCPGYPANNTELEEAVAAVLAQQNFTPQLTVYSGEDPWKPRLVARAVLRGLDMSEDDARSLLRKWKAWAGEQGTTEAAKK